MSNARCHVTSLAVFRSLAISAEEFCARKSRQNWYLPFGGYPKSDFEPPSITQIHFSKMGESAIALTKVGSVAAFEWRTAKMIISYSDCCETIEKNKITGANIHPDGCSALLMVQSGAATDEDTTVEVLDFVSGRQVRKFQSIRDRDRDAAFFQRLHVTSNGRLALAAGLLYSDEGGAVNQALVVWSIRTGLIERVLHILTPEVGIPWADEWPSALSRDGRYFALKSPGFDPHCWRVCDLQDGLKITEVEYDKGTIGDVLVLPRAGLLVATVQDSGVRAWSISSRAPIQEWNNQKGVSALSCSPSEQYMLIGTGDGEIHVTSVLNTSILTIFRVSAAVTALDVHPTLPLIAVGDILGQVHVLEIHNCRNW